LAGRLTIIRRPIRWLAGFGIALVTMPLLAASAATFDLQAHRGGRGLAPENTLAGFERAIALGVTTIEMDLAVTSDGVLVVAHDPYLNPDLVRDKKGQWLAARGPAIHALRLADLKQYEIGRIKPATEYAKQFAQQVPVDGQRFPTLTEVFALAPAGASALRFNLETKLTPMDPSATPDPLTFARLTVDAIRKAGLAPRVTVQSFDWRTVLEVKRIAPDIDIACLTIESPNFDTVQRASGQPSVWHAGFDLRAFGGSVPRLVKAAGCSTWSMFWRNLTPAALAEAHALGLKVLPWTVNDYNEMTRLVDMGVDGIITDYPDRLREAVSTNR
jgi:glycerophosphoryl diester phosphodiesterase